MSPRLAATMLVLVVLTLSLFAPVAHAQDPNEPRTNIASGAIFEQAWTIVRDRFFDPNMNGVDWANVRDELAPRAAATTNPLDLSAAINAALDRLRVSHTRHFHRAQREYYELLDIFNPDGIDTKRFPGCGTGLVHYSGIGIVTTAIDSHVYVAEVYEAGAAARAGLLVGDEIISVEGRPWSDIDALADFEGKPVSLFIQRTPDAASRMTLTVTPERIHPRTLFNESVKRSAKVIERDRRRLGYIRIRSYAHPSYQESLVDLLRTTLKDIDGLVLDLRGGWGGASPEYLNAFNPTVPSLQSRTREQAQKDPAAWYTSNLTFTKPLVVLIDRQSRSGKEILVYALKKHHRATLVGQTTAGAVLGGSPFVLDDGSILYLAVSDVKCDGERLEGFGVKADVEVSRHIPYAAGTDEQYKRALQVLADLVQKPESRGPPK